MHSGLPSDPTDRALDAEQLAGYPTCTCGAGVQVQEMLSTAEGLNAAGLCMTDLCKVFGALLVHNHIHAGSITDVFPMLEVTHCSDTLLLLQDPSPAAVAAAACAGHLSDCSCATAALHSFSCFSPANSCQEH